MKTTIYTGDDASLIENIGEMDVVWPEIGAFQPLHPRQIIEICPLLVGKEFCTLSEHVILWFQQRVRCGQIHPDDLMIIWIGENGATKVEVDFQGDLLNWPGSFFDERLQLLV